MIKILNLVGARPQFIKAAAVSRAFRKHQQQIEEILVHSGQHYDQALSDVFFRQLELPLPKYHLDAPKTSNEEQVVHIKHALKAVVEQEKPNVLLVYGDTTTTLAGALVGAEMKVPVAHIESGLRSYNTTMPEEYNRVTTDQLSRFLFVPTEQGIKNLKDEGLTDHPGKREVVLVGDVMLDCLRIFSHRPAESDAVKALLNTEKPLILVTLHRNFNADNPQALKQLVLALKAVSDNYEVAFPVHPRTRKALHTIPEAVDLTLLEPVSYFDMLALEQAASVIVTDSGGVQKEAFYFKKPLVILRPETEWTELVAHNVAKLCPVEQQAIIKAITGFNDFVYPNLPQFYGNGYSADKICEHLIAAFS